MMFYLSWCIFAFISTLVLILPFGIFPGVWSAPVQSCSGWIVLFLLWIGTGTVIFSKTTVTGKTRWILLFVLIITKFIFIWFSPQFGIWARITTKGLEKWSGGDLPVTTEVSPAPHITDKSGFVLRNDALIPPYFINDHRRFNYYPTHRFSRKDIPYRIELKGNIILPETPKPLIFPYGGRVQLEDGMTTASVGESIKVIPEDKKNLKFHYSTTASTKNPYPFWIMEKRDEQICIIPSWRFWSGESIPSSSFTALLMYSTGWIWNGLFLIFVLWVWKEPLKQLWNGLRDFQNGRLIIPLSVILSLIIPVQKGEYFIFSSFITILLIVIMAMLFYKEIIHKHREIQWKRIRKVFSIPGKAGILIAISLLIWCILGCRFFASRFPKGFATLPAGMDTFFHYTFGREILFGDWLHLKDAPFTRQPFIRYLLLLPMIIGGEGPAWGFVIHWLLFGLTGMLLWRILIIRSSKIAWGAYILWFAALPFNSYRIWVATLFPEMWGTFFLFLSFSLLILWFYSDEKPVIFPILAGVMLGFSIWTRNNFMTILPFWILIFVLIRNIRKRIKMSNIICFSLSCIFIVGIIPLRNTLLAPRAPFSFFMHPERSATDLFQGFQLEEIKDEDIESMPLSLIVSPAAARFFKGIQEKPVLFLKYQVDRILVFLGGPAFWEKNLRTFYPDINLWHILLWLLIMVHFFKCGFRNSMNFPALLSWSIILSQWCIIIFTGYVGEGYRFITPLYPFMMVIGLLPCRNSNHILKDHNDRHK